MGRKPPSHPGRSPVTIASFRDMLHVFGKWHQKKYQRSPFFLMILEFENQIEIFEEALVMSAGRALVRRAGAFDDTAAMQATPLGWLRG